MKLSNIIDITAAPVAAWVAIGQAIHKPWAHSGFIALGAVSAGLWVIKTLIQAKKKERLGVQDRKRSSGECKKNNSKSILPYSREKIKSEYKIPVWLREGKGSSNVYTVTVQPNSRRW